MKTEPHEELIERAARQLERSERGQLTCKLLRDFLKTHAVKGLDGENSMAVALLVQAYMTGTGGHACAVINQLGEVIERNKWVLSGEAVGK